MKTEWSEQYFVRCLVLEEGDDIDEAIDTIAQEECYVPGESEDQYVVRLPGKTYPELMTQSELRRQFPLKPW